MLGLGVVSAGKPRERRHVLCREEVTDSHPSDSAPKGIFKLTKVKFHSGLALLAMKFFLTLMQNCVLLPSNHLSRFWAMEPGDQGYFPIHIEAPQTPESSCQHPDVCPLCGRLLVLPTALAWVLTLHPPGHTPLPKLPLAVVPVKCALNPVKLFCVTP